MTFARAARAALGLAVAGAVFGAAAGMTVAILWVAVFIGPSALVELAAGYAMAAQLGAVCGAVLAPVASFTFMRHVPLWRVFAETTLGTVIGGALGLVLPTGLPIAIAVVGMAVIGFVLASARLARAFRVSRGSPPSHLLANDALQLTELNASGFAPNESGVRSASSRLKE